MFKRTILNGFALCGGACFYTYCICYSWKFLYNNFIKTFKKDEAYEKGFGILKSRVFNLMRVVLATFMGFASQLLEQSKLDYKIELSTGHLFKIDEKYCDCGLLSLNQNGINLANSYFTFDENSKFEQIDFDEILNLNENSLLKKSEENVKFIDCFESKINCFKVVRETLSIILNIGAFVND